MYGGSCRIRTFDHRIKKYRKAAYKPFNSTTYRGTHCDLCPTMHHDAQLIPAKSPQGICAVMIQFAAVCLRLILGAQNARARQSGQRIQAMGIDQVQQFQ
jgi:hypothetical protein